MTKHTLKIEPQYLEAIKDGSKTFEIRKNDRDYKVGDILALHEYSCGVTTGKPPYWVKITYISDYAQYGNYVVLAIKPSLMKMTTKREPDDDSQARDNSEV